MKKFDFDSWRLSGHAEQHAKAAMTVFNAVETPRDDERAILEAVACGVPRVAAMHLFYARFNRCAPMICPYCECRSRPYSPTYFFRRNCKNCGQKWASLSIVSPNTKRKQSARAAANMAVKRGKLKRQPCSICGEKISEKHHHDYSKPLDVTWLCRACHMAEHKRTA